MSGSKAQGASSRSSEVAIEPSEFNRSRFGLRNLSSYTALGAAGAALLAGVELIDLNIQLAPLFTSARDHLAFSIYLSVNILSGAVIGLFVGCFITGASALNRVLRKLLASTPVPHRLTYVLAGLFVAALAALLLNQQPHIHGYTIALIREAEKISLLRVILLNHERATSYLTTMGLFVVCWSVTKLVGLFASAGRWLQVGWMLAVAILIALVYYVDSRIEVQGYEYSLHRSMFLANTTLAMAVVASVYLYVSRLKRARQRKPPFISRIVAAMSALLIAAGVVFALLQFDKDHKLKTQLFYRTTQAKQHYKLAQWLLDFDRDGYSRFLGGGDPDDSNPQINAGRVEVVGDGVDNNCIGGDLTEKDLEGWNLQREARYQPADPAAKRLNVVYIFIDALRADHMSCYGYPRETTPNIDRLAAKSSVFERAHTPAPNTFEALPKFMQSNYWDGKLETWTEVLSRNGYHTILFPGRTSTMLRHVKGMETVIRERIKGLDKKVDFIISTLANHPADRPFYAFVYAVDPHKPYKEHADFYFGPTDTDLYDGEIAYTDQQVGRLFGWMEASGRDKDTLVVIMADHGESLGERAVYKHSRQLYNEQTQVPMIVYHPNLPPRRITDFVSTIDLGPTILTSVGLSYPAAYSGVSLLALMRGDPFTHPPVFAEQTSDERSPFVSADQSVTPEAKKYMVITQDGFKLIYNRNYSCFELYDLNHDLGEKNSLYEAFPGKADEMKRLLGRFIDVLSVSRPWNADESQAKNDDLF